MANFNIFISLIAILILPACAEQGSTEAGIKMTQYKWKNRIILTYPKNDTFLEEQRKSIEQQKAEIDERDLIILRVDRKLEGKDVFTEAQRMALLKKYRLIPGSHLLIGKDGDAKKKQLGKLNLLPLFKIIDQMPMRKAEMEQQSNL